MADSGFPCDGAALLGDTMKDTLCICVFIRNSLFKVLLETYVLNVDLGMVNNLVEELETWPGTWREYVTKFLLLQENIWERISTLTRRSEKGLNVLTHGDLWMNNIMFNEQANGIRFVEFQLANHTSPGIDLHLFICRSATLYVRMYHTNTLLEVDIIFNVVFYEWTTLSVALV